MRTLIAAGVTLTLLSGCVAPAPGYSWTKPGAVPTEFARDSFECKQTARATEPGGGFAMGGLAFVVIASAVRASNTHNAQQGIYNECMAALGYAPEQVVQQ
jgi:hypothetical protein